MRGDVMWWRYCRDGQGRPCTRYASGTLLAPNGRTMGWMCAQHARECIAEYAQKLGETWTFRADREGER